MAEIRIEGEEVWGDNMLDAGHLYLVYVDDDGEEYVIRGGPKGGYLSVNVGGLLKESGDARVKTVGENEIPVAREDRGSMVLDLGGRDPKKVWQDMLATAEKIHDAEFAYDWAIGKFGGYNSNTVIAAVLKNAGIDVENVLPEVEGVDGSRINGPYPGSQNALELIEELKKRDNAARAPSNAPGGNKQHTPETDKDHPLQKDRQPNRSRKESLLDLKKSITPEPIKGQQDPMRTIWPEPQINRTDPEPQTLQHREYEQHMWWKRMRNPNIKPLINIGQGQPGPEPESSPASQITQHQEYERHMRWRLKRMRNPNIKPLINLGQGQPGPEPESSPASQITQHQEYERHMQWRLKRMRNPNIKPLLDFSLDPQTTQRLAEKKRKQRLEEEKRQWLQAYYDAQKAG